MNPDNGISRDGEALFLQGKVGFHTANDIYRAIRQELVTPGITTLDCTRVEQCDSSAIGLLLAALRLADKQGLRLQVRGLTAQMQSLARLYEVRFD